jgi:predicted RNA methylase
MPTEKENESNTLGQFIPLHYHHNMLLDERRMTGFKSAIDHAVSPGARVLELGGGTGVLSWFASAKAEKVWCVEFNPELVAEARRFLSLNENGYKVEVVHANAFDYLPPEPVDVVICEMIHTAMIREKQVEVIQSFKSRYLQRFGNPMPTFIPESVIMAVQPLCQNYNFNGYRAPIIQFQDPFVIQAGSVELAQPAVYSILDFTQPTEIEIRWKGEFKMEKGGEVNALRFITKNVLAVQLKQATTIDWLGLYLVLPLNKPVVAKAGDTLEVDFAYTAGGSIASLQNAIHASLK